MDSELEGGLVAGRGGKPDDESEDGYLDPDTVISLERVIDVAESLPHLASCRQAFIHLIQKWN